jgi:serine protease
MNCATKSQSVRVLFGQRTGLPRRLMSSASKKCPRGMGTGLAVIASAVLATGCGVESSEDLDLGTTLDGRPSFAEFEAATYREPWDGGVYIVDGDTPIANHKLLREFYNQMYSPGALIVHQAGGADASWNSLQKAQLTYCVSDSFGALKDQLIAAMVEATDEGWELAANVDFVHVPEQDANCTASNDHVMFDVRPVRGAGYLARAFFPDQGRRSRNVIVDLSSFSTSWPLSGILAHELGHALGFRHEHTRPEAGRCFEDFNWRDLTPYDSTSVMHYPQCNGTGQALTISDRDVVGAQALYGAPGEEPDNGDGDGGDDGDDQPIPNVPRTATASGTLAEGEIFRYEAVQVAPGTIFEAETTGTGDADLYVRFDSQPTEHQFDCRSYTVTSDETCALDVPAGASTAHVMVRGYQAATFDLSVSWFEPAPK